VKVHPDCHVVIAGSFYSVPFKYVGQTLAAHVSENMVEIYCGTELVSNHVRATKPRQWHTHLNDYPPAKAAYLIRTPAYCRELAAKIGPSAQEVIEYLLADRPLDRLRTVQAILHLEESVGPKRLEGACARAVYFGVLNYREIKKILNAALDREPLPQIQNVQPVLSHIFARAEEEFFGHTTGQLACPVQSRGKPS
jgi:hypothetical protein